jgi:predicted RNase H-like nuclease (RuvC/YqgF family)
VSVGAESRSREELAELVEKQQEEIDELRREIRELDALTDAHGRQLARIRAAIAGDEGEFWVLDEIEDGPGVVERLAIIEGKMDGFAERLRAPSGGSNGGNR